MRKQKTKTLDDIFEGMGDNTAYYASLFADNIIEYTEYHVKAALSKANKKVLFGDDLQNDVQNGIYHMSSVYPLTNIK